MFFYPVDAVDPGHPVIVFYPIYPDCKVFYPVYPVDAVDPGHPVIVFYPVYPVDAVDPGHPVIVFYPVYPVQKSCIQLFTYGVFQNLT
jgi:hypothetical protein